MKTVYTIILSFFCLFSFAQKETIQFKKISNEEIQLTVYEPYPNAPAVILYDIGNLYFDINPTGENLFLFQKRHVRIKILNEDGLKYAKMRFVFKDMNCEQLYGELSYNLKAFTHNISQTGELISTRLKNKNIKIKDSLNCFKIAEVTFPNVQVGSIIEYVLIIPTLKMIHPDSWYFEREIPVIHSEFKAYVPDEFEYIFSLKNTNDIQVNDSSFYDNVINYRFRYGNYMVNSRINLSGKMFHFVKTNNPVIDLAKNAQKINIHLKQVNTKSSDYAWEIISRALMITTWDDYDSRSPGQRKLLPYPPAYVIYYLPSWDESNEKLQKSDQFGQALLKFWDCDSILESILQNKIRDIEKTETIYNFVKANMKWNDQYAIYVDVSDNFFKTLYGKTGAKVNYNNVGIYFKNGEGNSAEINFVLMYLLKRAKLQVSPVLVNTVEDEPVDFNIPDFKQFKSVIALVQIDGENILLDAADPKSSFNALNDKYDPKQMYVIRNENPGWLNRIE